VRTVIAGADRPGVLVAAAEGDGRVGTVVLPHDRKLSARKLWIGFAVGSSGTVVVDDGARRALVERQTSLLPAGVVDVQGDFDAEDAVELADASGQVFAKGLVRYAANALKGIAGSRTSDLPDGFPHEVVHRDDLVVLP
jgi:glutamate 5-kinase